MRDKTYFHHRATSCRLIAREEADAELAALIEGLARTYDAIAERTADA